MRVGQVGPVADHQVDRAVEVGQRVRGIALVDDDAGAHGIAPGPLAGGRFPLDRVHRSARDLLGYRKCDDARTGAEIDDERRPVPGRLAKRVDAPAGHDFGLGTRHEDARPDGHLEVAKRRAAGEVLKRHARRPAVDQTGEDQLLSLREITGDKESASGTPDDERGKRFGVVARGRDSGRGQLLVRVVDGDVQPDRRQLRGGGFHHDDGAPVAAIRVAESASTSAWITASRSPSSTWSRLYALKFTRWSEIRFSG